MISLVTALCFVSLTRAVSTVSHTLEVHATFIHGETPFPEFSLVLVLDDIQVGYYDSDSMKYTPRRYNASWETEKEMQADASAVFGRFYNGMKISAKLLESCFNVTDLINVFQRFCKCEILDDVPGLSEGKNTFNGLIGEVITFDVQHNHFQIKADWPSDCYEVQTEQSKWLVETIYHPFCMKYLTRFLKERMQDIQEVKPEVRLLRKSFTNSNRLRITCLATGFYPQHINVTLLRDDQPVSEDQVTGGILLPNADGTYQMRKSVEVSAEELRQHKYSCRVTHLSLDIRLDMTSDGVSIIIYVVVALLVLVMICVISIVIWRKRAGSKQSDQVRYTAASESEEKKPSADKLAPLK